MAAMMSHPKMSNQPDSRTGTSLLDWGAGAVEGLGTELTSFLGNEGEFWVDTSHRADMNCQGLRYPRTVAALKESWVIHRKLCPRGLFRVLSVNGEHGTNLALGGECEKEAGVSVVLGSYMVYGEACEAVVSLPFAPYVVYGGPCVFPVTLLTPVLPPDTEWLP